MATPTSTSVGASAPKAIRPSAVRATSAATTHLPVLRQRPSGTNVYKTTTSDAVKKVICSDGIAQPPQPSRIIHPERPRALGERATMFSASKLSTWARITRTIRCRKRRSTSSASSSPYNSPVKDPPGAEGRQRPPDPHQPWSLQPTKPLRPPRRRPPSRPRQGRAARGRRPRSSAPTSTSAATSQRDPAGLQVMGQRRRLPGGPPAAARRTVPGGPEWAEGPAPVSTRPRAASMAPPNRVTQAQPDDLVGWLPPCQGRGCCSPSWWPAAGAPTDQRRKLGAVWLHAEDFDVGDVGVLDGATGVVDGAHLDRVGGHGS